MDKDMKKFIDNLNKWIDKDIISKLKKMGIDIDNLNKLQKIFLLISIGFLIMAIISFVFVSNFNVWNDAHMYPLGFSFVAYIGMRLFKDKNN